MLGFSTDRPFSDTFSKHFPTVSTNCRHNHLSPPTRTRTLMSSASVPAYRSTAARANKCTAIVDYYSLEDHITMSVEMKMAYKQLALAASLFEKCPFCSTAPPGRIFTLCENGCFGCGGCAAKLELGADDWWKGRRGACVHTNCTANHLRIPVPFVPFDKLRTAVDDATEALVHALKTDHAREAVAAPTADEMETVLDTTEEAAVAAPTADEMETVIDTTKEAAAVDESMLGWELDDEKEKEKETAEWLAATADVDESDGEQEEASKPKGKRTSLLDVAPETSDSDSESSEEAPKIKTTRKRKGRVVKELTEEERVEHKRTVAEKYKKTRADNKRMRLEFPRFEAFARSQAAAYAIFKDEYENA